MSSFFGEVGVSGGVRVAACPLKTTRQHVMLLMRMVEHEVRQQGLPEYADEEQGQHSGEGRGEDLGWMTLGRVKR